MHGEFVKICIQIKNIGHTMYNLNPTQDLYIYLSKFKTKLRINNSIAASLNQ